MSMTRDRHYALALAALIELAERDPSISGVTILIPGERQPVYLSADLVRRQPRTKEPAQ